MVPEFQDFPSTQITVEFWMQSVDTCRPGVPFSYAHGRYEQEDNSFLVFNYNSWCAFGRLWVARGRVSWPRFVFCGGWTLFLGALRIAALFKCCHRPQPTY